MLGTEFKKYFESFPYLKQYFAGIFAADELPKKLKNDYFIICNTDLSSGPGKHWYCLARFNDCIECFDSLGVDDSKKAFLSQLPLVQNVGELDVNTTQLQSENSNACGEFVIYFVVQRFHNKDQDLNSLLNDIFTFDTENNEIKVKKFLLTHF